MAKEKILVVDDEEDILKLIEYSLTNEGYSVIQACTGEDALIKSKAQIPNLIILDLMLPGVDGLEVCKAIKNNPELSRIPIIMLTAKGEDSDIITGLEIGADDYITKPFSPKVLIAKVRAAFRRNRNLPASDSDIISYGNLLIDPIKHRVTVDGKSVDLTLTEYKLLHFLAKRPGWVFTRYQIVEATQGDDADVTDRSVDVHVVSLRKKLGSARDCMETVRGVGYRFKEH